MSRRLAPLLVVSSVLNLGASTPALAADAKADVLSPAEAKRRDAVFHFMRARMLAADSEFEESLKEFRKAVEGDPGDVNLRREYAEMLRDLSILPEAEQEARKAVELSPSHPWANRVLGQVLLVRAKDRKTTEEAAAALKKANDGLPGDPVGATSYAQALLKLDRAAEAATVLERVLDKGRGSAIPLLYGEALERSGRAADAEELYRTIVAHEPENRAASMGLLRVFERGRQFDKALPIVEGFLRSQPGNLGLKIEYGTILMRARRYGDAAKVLKEVLAADPSNRDGLRHYGTLLSETREFDKADEVLAKLQGLEPDDPDVAFRRALNFLEARRLPEAERLLKELRASLVKKGRSQDELAQVDGQLGYAAYLGKDYSEARARLLPHLFDEDGVNSQAFNLLLQIARDTEDVPEGIRIAREVNGKTKKTIGTRALLGEFLARSAKGDEKSEGETLLAEIAKEGKEGALAAADAWQRLEQHARAAATARLALETFKDDPDLLFRLAASLEREKKIGESVQAFERLLAARSDHAPGLNYLGYLWADRGENLPRALDLVRKAVELDPTNAAYLDSLGWVYYQLGRLDEAEANLLAAAELNPDDATIAEHQGDVYEKRGDLTRARQSWMRAQKLKPEDGGKKLEAKLKRTAARDGAVVARDAQGPTGPPKK